MKTNSTLLTASAHQTTRALSALGCGTVIADDITDDIAGNQLDTLRLPLLLSSGLLLA